ncbi:MAG: 3-phosphoshikimate 1-carboxyvinyltransferase [Rikenellaceae bacterium]|nr:3-phosphoshikimate 1-carboxyvinyltransferase [Rikenellaceae bacterium]MBQ3254889.1 3-phosphoshikimate 1-carboxyvinyltransferase [Rikenellaceae bacterium]
MKQIISSSAISGSITPPCSKSYAQRALAVALLADGESTIGNLELCDDTRSAIRCIEALGAEVTLIDDSTIRVRGGLAPRTDRLHIGESGLATRLFTPIASLHNQPITINGEGTILYRPISMMIDPLRQLGVEVRDGGGFLPIQVCGPMQGGEVAVDGSISSQFLTGLLLSLPMAQNDTTIYVKNLKSLPYVDMTIDTARRFGVEIAHKDYCEFFIEGNQHYTATDYMIEGDWSGAAPMFVAGAVAGEVTVENISRLSLQADTAIIDALISAGAEVESTDNAITVRHRRLKAFEFDATHCPDLFPALVALAANCEGTSTLYGTERLLHKESNRAATLAEEYAKAGIEVDIDEQNIMRVRGGKIHGCTADSHGDHRIAMSMAIAALTADAPITIEGAECVAKSYPSFFDDLEQLRSK